MKKLSTSTISKNYSLKSWSRKSIVLVFTAVSLMSTACSKEEEEVRPESEQKEIQKVTKDFTAIKPVMVPIKSEEQQETSSDNNQ